ncbi:MAG TPA: TraR/DksA family transcriptional regulator [Terrimicrobiaceae bacterium]
MVKNSRRKPQTKAGPRGTAALAVDRRELKPPKRPDSGGGICVPKRWIWHYETLSSLLEGLLRERKERLSEVAEPIEPHSMDLADSATDEFDHEIALSRLSVDQDALYEVEAAMKRILDGTYGICEQSGKPIPAARLKALPWTRFRKEAANRLERTGMFSQTRLGPLRSVREELSADEPSSPALTSPRNESGKRF